MVSSEDYLKYVLDILSDAEDITYRKMMGEYILYCGGKVFGGIYDDRFLVKDIPAARRLLPDASREAPYEGAKKMLSVDTEDRERLRELVGAMYDALPTPKKRGK